jgi:phosphohistidine swiveling domain-containing protein
MAMCLAFEIAETTGHMAIVSLYKGIQIFVGLQK